MFENWPPYYFCIAGKPKTFCENGRDICFYKIKRSYSQIH